MRAVGGGLQEGVVEEGTGFAEGGLDLALEGYDSGFEGVLPDKQSELCWERVEDGEGFAHWKGFLSTV